MTTLRILSSVILIIALASCGHRHDAEHAHNDDTHDESRVRFHPEEGLFIPAETAQFIGLELAEVAAREMESDLEFVAQVFRAAGETRRASPELEASTALASGTVFSGDAVRLMPDQAVSISTQNGNSLSGRVLSLESHLEESDGTTEVLLAIADFQNTLENGAMVSVTVLLGRELAETTVPRTAILRTTEGDFVYLAKDEHLLRTRVETGARSADYVQVKTGLKPGDRVVVHPVMTLWMAELQTLRGGASAHAH